MHIHLQNWHKLRMAGTVHTCDNDLLLQQGERATPVKSGMMYKHVHSTVDTLPTSNQYGQRRRQPRRAGRPLGHVVVCIFRNPVTVGQGYNEYRRAMYISVALYRLYRRRDANSHGLGLLINT